MSDHFCRAESRFIYGQGTRHRTVCSPCRWTSQWHRTKALANADYTDHSTPAKTWSEPTDLELVDYGMPAAFVTGEPYGTDPRGRRRA